MKVRSAHTLHPLSLAMMALFRGPVALVHAYRSRIARAPCFAVALSNSRVASSCTAVAATLSAGSTAGQCSEFLISNTQDEGGCLKRRTVVSDIDGFTSSVATYSVCTQYWYEYTVGMLVSAPHPTYLPTVHRYQVRVRVWHTSSSAHQSSNDYVSVGVDGT